MALKVNVVAEDNAVGVSRDSGLLVAVLRAAGCDVTVTAVSKHGRRDLLMRLGVRARLWRARLAPHSGEAPRFDLAVMLEHVWPQALPTARRRLVIPNPEFFDRADRRLLPWVDRVCAKTQHAYELFARRAAPVTLMGFDSEDRHDAAVPRIAQFLHVAGKSRLKGTARLVAVWRRHPEWPLLTVVQSGRRPIAESPAPNVRFRSEYLRDEELRRLQNEHLFHVCTSETEGWGHYIAEAASVGAVVLATDAPPMNELVRPERGLLVGCRAAGRKRLATVYEFDEPALERAVESALALGVAERERLGRAARAWFVANHADFAARVQRSILDR